MKKEAKPRGFMEPGDYFAGVTGFMENADEVFVGKSAESWTKEVIPVPTANEAMEDCAEETAGIFELKRTHGTCG